MSYVLLFWWTQWPLWSVNLMFLDPLEQELTVHNNYKEVDSSTEERKSNVCRTFTFAVLGILDCCSVTSLVHYHPFTWFPSLKIYSHAWYIPVPHPAHPIACITITSPTDVLKFLLSSFSPHLLPWSLIPLFFSFCFHIRLFCESVCVCTCVEVTGQLASSRSSPSIM